MRDQRRPTILVTGASGFIGRYFLQAAKEKYRVFAIARRSQIECNAPRHQNIEWFMVDIGEREELKKVLQDIESKSEIDFILHLAGYYDFDCMESPEYERTNVQGTRNLLELTKMLNIKRFIFASSITVCDFKKSEMPVTEKSPPNAHFPYAVSKRKCEEMLQEFKDDYACTAIRFAAVFSDWCEYEPLYALMSTWVSGKWNSRMLGGKGQTAITYIHINCAVLFILRVMEQHERMRRMDILIASCSISNSHSKLFELTTRLFFGKARKPIFIPKPLAALGIFLRCALGKVLNKKPFEKMWMVPYIDRFISCNPKYSFEILPFKIRDRYHLRRRMIYLIENMKKSQDAVGLQITLIYKLLTGCVRHNDNSSFISYIRYLASIRRKEDFPESELIDAISQCIVVAIERVHKFSKISSVEMIIEHSIRPNIESVAREIKSVYSESVIL